MNELHHAVKQRYKVILLISLVGYLSYAGMREVRVSQGTNVEA